MLFQPTKYLTRLKILDQDDARETIRKYKNIRPIFLFRPATSSDARSMPMNDMNKIIGGIDYIHQDYVGLDRVYTEEDYQSIKKRIRKNCPNTIVAWNNDPRLQPIFKKIAKKVHLPSEKGKGKDIDEGKGRNFWIGLTYFCSTQKKDDNIFMTHDCDIKNYDERFLINLPRPLIDPRSSFEINIGSAERIEDKELKGRVSRLFYAPFLCAMEDVYGKTEELIWFFVYRREFTYPFQAECAFLRKHAGKFGAQDDWGVEERFRMEVHELGLNYTQLAETNLGLYIHKHQRVHANEPKKGLRRMVTDISKTNIRGVFRIGGKDILSIDENGKVTQESINDMYNMRRCYTKHSKLHLTKFWEQSKNASLEYNKKREEKIIDTMIKPALEDSIATVIKNPMELRRLPSYQEMDPPNREEITDIIKDQNSELENIRQI